RVGDVLTKRGKLQNACGASAVREAHAFGGDVLEVAVARHALGVDPGHATDVRVPGKWSEAVLHAHEVGLFEGSFFHLVGFNGGRRGRGFDSHWTDRRDKPGFLAKGRNRDKHQ